MKKILFTLNVNNYAPELTALTYPLLKGYAHKIGADFCVISERRYPDWPAVYEKFQIYDLLPASGADWAVYIDSDALIHPDMFDITEHLPLDTVAHYASDLAGNRWRYDDYFRRDGRHIGSGNWFAVASRWCCDLWHPLEDMTLRQAAANIFPQVSERDAFPREHLIDDYVCSRNIARYGLKFTTVTEVLRKLGRPNGYAWHQYTVPLAEKVVLALTTLQAWGIPPAGTYTKGATV